MLQVIKTEPIKEEVIDEGAYLVGRKRKAIITSKEA